MSNGRSVVVFLGLSLMANAFCAPTSTFRRRRGFDDNQIDSKESPTKLNAASEQKKDVITTVSSTTSSTTEGKSGEDEVDFNEEFNSPPSAGGGGSNIFTLLNVANALFPASSGTTNKVRDKIHNFMKQNKMQFAHRRQYVADNEIEIEYKPAQKPQTTESMPTFQRQENSESESASSESNSDSEEDNRAEENAEKESNENAGGDTSSTQDSASIEGNNDSDYEEPEGDGQGGGLLGLLAGLSGDGGSDLGSLLGVLGTIVINLSGGDLTLNDAIESAISLLVGLLSGEDENPGEVIASYLQTLLDTLTGGGAQNNGKFFGIFISKLLKGISAAGTPEETEDNEMPMTDSGGFLFSLLMGLLGDMSKFSFGSSSKPWR